MRIFQTGAERETVAASKEAGPERARDRSVLSRRSLLGVLAAGAAGLGAVSLTQVSGGTPEPAFAIDEAFQAEWRAFYRRFGKFGRIIDNGNGGISHSEGQGTGLLCSAAADDRAAFDEIHRWTVQTLRRGTDRLHHWRYRPGLANPVDDQNNATDGDLLIAYGLFVGASRWNDPALREEATLLARDIAELMTVQTEQGTLLMPGEQGFRFRDHVIINPSYYVMPAIAEIERQTGDAIWRKLRADGVRLLRSARFGRWQLPADWIAVHRSGEVAPADGWPARFSWDAVRVPLYLAWAGMENEPVVGAAQQFWSQFPVTPAWTNLDTNGLAPFGASPGVQAIHRLIGSTEQAADATPSVDQASDYYSAALILLSKMASEQRPSLLARNQRQSSVA